MIRLRFPLCVSAGLALATVFCAVQAAPGNEPCMRYHAKTVTCELVAGAMACMAAPMSDTQINAAQYKTNGKKYHSSPDPACRELARYSSLGLGIDKTPKYELVKVPSGYMCRYAAVSDRNNDMSNYTDLPYDQVNERDPCCGRVPNNAAPYAGLRVPPNDPDVVHPPFESPNRGPGSSFLSSQRERIKNANWSRTGHTLWPDGSRKMRSDAAMIPGVTEPNADLRSYGANQVFADRAEVHHIVPRLDSRGCPCGSSGYGNALLISNSLNNTLSNDRSNPMHEALIQRFTKWP